MDLEQAINKLNKMDRLEKVRKLFKKYDLSESDYFKHPQGWVIITLPGCEKIAAKENIAIQFKAKVLEPDFAVIKAIATKDGRSIETFGSAKIGGFGKGTTQSHYVAEIAEKRSLVRAVLKMENLYAEGVYSEEESESFKDDRVEINTKQLSQMKDGILRGEYTADEAFAKAEGAGLLIPESLKYTYRKLKTAEG